MQALYNDNDRFCCDWLSNLMDAGHITPGKIDDRSIADFRPQDLKGYDVVHFFAGIGGWDAALQISKAQWRGQLWTGSCPCQPFSTAGKGKAADDQRHLWPTWFSLVKKCHPAIILGEQVEAAIGWGWLDLVCSDLESQGYACGSAVLPACGVGAPHIRQRLWFVGHAESRDGRLSNGKERREDSELTGASEARELGLTERKRLERYNRNGHTRHQSRWVDSRTPRSIAKTSWTDCDWIKCTDGKARPVESGTQPLATGIPQRLGRLRAYGNSIAPQVAAVFIEAALAPYQDAPPLELLPPDKLMSRRNDDCGFW